MTPALKVVSLALVLALAALFGTRADRGAYAASCRHVDAVFYSTDSVRLSQRLHLNQSACTDYYISVTPTSDGWPRSANNPGPGIRANGPAFHAMPEVRPALLAGWLAANPGKTWYDLGVEFRRRMGPAGFDAAAGDSWVINDVGWPTTSTTGAAVFAGIGTARADLLELIRGLYTGDAGMTSAPGAIFGAGPVQVTTDLDQYKQQLQAFYSDSTFWAGLSGYVRFWAQDTWSDAREWGVAGSTLADRVAYLDDYFLHPMRLAIAGGDGTAAARAFFASAFTPLGNAAFRWGAPTPPGPGFGFTDIGLPGMQNFVSTQAYALRSASPERFGFGVVPNGATTTDTIAVEDRVAAAIHDSDAAPIGACGASGEWCDSSVDGAAFTDAWKTFTDVTPPVITPHIVGTLGSPGWYVSDVSVTWTVTDPESSFTASGCDAATITADTAGITLTCTATSYGGTATGSATVKRDATPPTLTVPTADVVADATSPAGEAVAFTATATDTIDSAPSLQCTPASGSVFTIGTTTVTCTASDDAGNHTTATFSVYVRGAAAQTAALIDLVVATGAKQGVVNSLNAKLAAVQLAVAADNADKRADAAKQLQAFTNEVEAQSGKALSADQASQLIAAAQQIEAVLGP